MSKGKDGSVIDKTSIRHLPPFWVLETGKRRLGAHFT